MDQFSNFMTQDARLVVGVLSVVGLIAFMYKFHGFLLMDLYYKFWKTWRLSGDLTKDGSPNRTRSESLLCHDYSKHIKVISSDEFARNRAYLLKSGDTGRRPTTVGMWAVVCILVVLEALGFSYLLGTWIASDSSEYMRMGLMVAVVIVFAILFPWIMHAGGHNLYETLLYKKQFRAFKESGGSHLATRPVSLADDQRVDDGEPSYVQAVNRINGGTGTPVVFVISLLAIALVLAGSTYMRVAHLDKMLTQEARVQTQPIDSGNPFAQGLPDLPDAVTAAQKKVDKKVISDEMKDTQHEGIAAFVVLGVIFLMTQFLGLFMGYTRSFGGKESGDAYANTMGISTYSEYAQMIRPRLQIAESRLKSLQQKMEQKSPTRQSYNLTFQDFMASQKDVGEMINNIATNRAAKDNPAQVAQPVAQVQLPGPVGADPLPGILAVLDSKTEPESKVEYLATLDAAMRERVKGELSERKKRGSAADVAASFEGLL